MKKVNSFKELHEFMRLLKEHRVLEMTGTNLTEYPNKWEVRLTVFYPTNYKTLVYLFMQAQYWSHLKAKDTGETVGDYVFLLGVEVEVRSMVYDTLYWRVRYWIFTKFLQARKKWMDFKRLVNRTWRYYRESDSIAVFAQQLAILLTLLMIAQIIIQKFTS